MMMICDDDNDMYGDACDVDKTVCDDDDACDGNDDVKDASGDNDDDDEKCELKWCWRHQVV